MVPDGDNDKGVAGCVHSAFVATEEIHSANRGVIFHRTAPVVPPALGEESSEGDCWIVYSLACKGISTEGARESIKPRFFAEGMGRVKRRKDSFYFIFILMVYS